MALASIPDDIWFHDLPAVDGIETVTWDLQAPHPRADEITFVVPPYIGGGSALEVTRELPALEVVQLLSAGYDSAVAQVPEHVTLCNAAGVHDTSTAELAVTLALSALRGIPAVVDAQRRGEWLPMAMRDALADRRVLLLGYGNIGRAIAARLRPFEVQLTAVATRERPGDGLVDAVHAIDRLPELAATTDVLIAIVPLTDATTGVIGKEVLAALPDGALVVNVARGKVVDTDALVREAGSGRLRAALDVTDPEPLPSGHPLWSMPNVLITPHIGGASSAFMPRAKRLVVEQLRRYAAGQPLEHVVRPGRSRPAG